MSLVRKRLTKPSEGFRVFTIDTTSNDIFEIGKFDNLEKALAVWYRPITKRKADDSYSIEPYEPHVTKQEEMLDMTMDVVVGAMVFFYRIERRLAIDSRLSSIRQARKALKTKSTTNGVGTE